jgi:hypothetical protein
MCWLSCGGGPASTRTTAPAEQARQDSNLQPPVLEMSVCGRHQGTPGYTVHILPGVWAGSKGVVSTKELLNRTQTGPTLPHDH